MTRIIAPYGAWVSPVTTELMTASAVGLSGLTVDGKVLYWLEGRPSEGGRTVFCRRADGEIDDLTPAPFNVGSRVHEYGGGAFAVARAPSSLASAGTVGLAHRGGTRAAPIETPEGCRYADFELDLPAAAFLRCAKIIGRAR